ncbi:MAG: response regulator transcription factor [Rhodanobacter sp.]
MIEQSQGDTAAWSAGLARQVFVPGTPADVPMHDAGNLPVQASQAAEPSTIRVAIADDHAVVRTGYSRLLELEPGLQVVAEFGDGESAYAWLSENIVEVLILDLSMPGRGGLATLLRLHQRVPELRVLVFTMHDNPQLAAQAIRAGASGYLTKSSAPELLVEAVLQIAAGGRPLSAGIETALGKKEGERAHRRLSPREFDIFLLLARGGSVEEIASQRCLSVKTAANYQTIVRHKLGLNSALEMYRYAQACGLLVDA